ncbi:nucleotide exchange factor GrpE [Ornithinimicrobium sufpigmenti]|uniref:nucleotide exchange factor GrpE n=1 Tax=Ornithinimicrobium sufpigmenti TaxID=2508882 RepID=UPI0010363C26|nr:MULTISPECIES: nucleotide exchange factor GrpE [unclassified Ornithinimicrobium]
MTDVNRTPTGGPSEEEAAGKGPVIRDKRRIDPETGQPRQVADPQPTAPEDAQAASAEQAGAGNPAGSPAGNPAADGEADEGDLHPDTQLAAERLEEMRRMQAEFVNFRNRTQREREADRTRATGAVVEAMLPLLDDIHSAREHGDLEEGTPFAAMADKLEATLGRFGVERTGFVGEVFDPTVHEALMHMPADSPGVELPEGATEMTIVQVMQPGFKIGDQVVRAARVAVADPS